MRYWNFLVMPISLYRKLFSSQTKGFTAGYVDSVFAVSLIRDCLLAPKPQ